MVLQQSCGINWWAGQSQVEGEEDRFWSFLGTAAARPFALFRIKLRKCTADKHWWKVKVALITLAHANLGLTEDLCYFVYRLDTSGWLALDGGG